MDFTYHTHDLVAIKSKPVQICCIYYLYDPPNETELLLNRIILLIYIFIIIKVINNIAEKSIRNNYLTSFALLIQRLAIKYFKINEKHIGIFGRGSEKDFNISKIVQENQIAIQLTIDEIYTSRYAPSEVNIIPFKYTYDLICSIKSFF